MKNLTRSELAKVTGIGIEGLRFYEQKGLIRKPKRSHSGYRLYTDEDATQIRFIKRAQQLGFTLGEIKSLLDLQSGGKSTCGPVRKRAELKIQEIKNKIRDLNKMLRSLREISDCCSRGEPTHGCSMRDCFEGKCKV